VQLNIAKEVAALKRMTVTELRIKYAEVFGEETRGNNKPWLIKRIAWRLQALAEGDLSERARQRAAELANDADLRVMPPRTFPLAVAAPERSKTATLPVTADQRLPVPGSILTRVYKGETLQVQVLADGFEFESQRYKSLSAVAKAITGSHCNGFLFFRSALNGKENRDA
jgi:hypothetical protein